MWISSLVITLSGETANKRPILDALELMPVFTLGVLQGDRLPVVIEAPDGSTARYWHEWVEQLPGVVHVALAFVSFDEESDEESSGDCADAAPRPAGTVAHDA